MTAICVVTHPDIGPYEKLYIDLFATEMTFDTAGTMVVLRIGATVYSMNWVGAPDVKADGTRQQYARSSAMFCGSAVVPLPGDVQLTAGRYIGWPVITLTNGQQVQLPPSPIDVR